MSEVEVPDVDPDELNDMLDYLDTLRDSAAINMLGAGPYVEDQFDLDKRTARKVLTYWMETFGSRE